MDWTMTEKNYSQRKACALAGIDRKSYRYASKRPDDETLRTRLRELASERRRFGCLIGTFQLLAAPQALHPLVVQLPASTSVTEKKPVPHATNPVSYDQGRRKFQEQFLNA